MGREGCKKGVCTMEIKSETMSVSFSNLGIQCVKKKDIEDALKVREEIRVDPFRSKSEENKTLIVYGKSSQVTYNYLNLLIFYFSFITKQPDFHIAHNLQV